jgi:hypothetical protein
MRKLSHIKHKQKYHPLLTSLFREINVLGKLLRSLPEKERIGYYSRFLECFRKYLLLYRQASKELIEKKKGFIESNDDHRYRLEFQRPGTVKHSAITKLLSEAVRHEMDQERRARDTTPHIEQLKKDSNITIIPTISLPDEPEYISIGHLKLYIDR